MKKLPLTKKDFEYAAKDLQCEVAAIQAVDAIESLGKGFYDTGEPVILFERHVFRKLTRNKYDATHPHLSNKVAGGYPRVSSQNLLKLKEAASLDREAALQSCSWGRFQIMGFNHALAGHPTLQEFINAMYASEAWQLKGFVSFLHNTGLVLPLRAKQWAKFARGYNGPGYAKNAYDVKLQQAYNKFSKR